MRTKGILTTDEDGKIDYQIINEWQLCPKCNGNGYVWMVSTTGQQKCNVCNGQMIISKVNGLPPGFHPFNP